MTILINLDDLMQSHIDECAANAGSMLYSAPCIIGTLVPAEDRSSLDENSLHVRALARQGRIRFPDVDQEIEARALQRAFDDSDDAKLAELLGARGLNWPF